MKPSLIPSSDFCLLPLLNDCIIYTSPFWPDLHVTSHVSVCFLVPPLVSELQKAGSCFSLFCTTNLRIISRIKRHLLTLPRWTNEWESVFHKLFPASVSGNELGSLGIIRYSVLTSALQHVCHYFPSQTKKWMSYRLSTLPMVRTWNFRAGMKTQICLDLRS